jgi:hypothetical protein
MNIPMRDSAVINEIHFSRRLSPSQSALLAIEMPEIAAKFETPVPNDLSPLSETFMA